MGGAQAIALAPGVSRSGVTMAAGRLRGLDRASAARLSFLLAIPVTAGAGALKTAEALSAGIPGELLGAFAVGIVASAGTGVAAIAFLMKRISGRGFRPYIVYRMGAGLTLLALAIVRR
jgi:undecaprenyl-diphosphatase